MVSKKVQFQWPLYVCTQKEYFRNPEAISSVKKVFCEVTGINLMKRQSEDAKAPKSQKKVKVEDETMPSNDEIEKNQFQLKTKLEKI